MIPPLPATPSLGGPLGLQHLLSTTVSTELKPLKLFVKGDMGLPKEIQKGGLNAETRCNALNQGFEGRQDDLSIKLEKKTKTLTGLQATSQAFVKMLNALTALGDSATWGGLQASVNFLNGDAAGAYVSAQVQEGVLPSKYTLLVKQLAQADAPFSTVSVPFPGMDEPFGSAGILFINGNPINLTPETTFSVLMNAMNSLPDCNVRPLIVKKPQPQPLGLLLPGEQPSGQPIPGECRLLITSTQPGESLYIRDDQGGKLLSDLGIVSNPASSSKTAQLEIDGTTIERDTNTLDDILPGITLELKKTWREVDNPIIVDIQNKADPVIEELQNFVQAYGDYAALLQSQTTQTLENAAPLDGFPFLRLVENSVRLFPVETCSAAFPQGLGLNMSLGSLTFEPEALDLSPSRLASLQEFLLAKDGPLPALLIQFKGFEANFSTALERTVQDIERIHDNNTTLQTQIDQQKAKWRQASARLQQIVQVGKLQQDFQSKMMDAMLGSDT